MIARRHAIARLQSDFFRDQYHRVLRWLMGSICIIFILIGIITYYILSEPRQDYYANTTSGRILPMPNTT